MENGKDKNGKFAIGNKPPANRKTRGVSGRRKTLDLMDKMLAKADNQTIFEEALQEAFEKNPVKFWKTYVMPVLPSLAKDPELEEKLAYTDEKRLSEITTIFNIARKRLAGQAAKDDSFVESKGIEFPTN